MAWLIQSCAASGSDYAVTCFIEDDAALQGKSLNGVPTMSLEDARRRFPDSHVVGGVGQPKTREFLMAKSQAAGFCFASIVHPRVERSEWVEIGTGTLICAGTILTTNIVIGNHVHVNLDCTIGHDAILDDYTTLAPGVHVSGWVHMGRRVYVGTGAVIINGTSSAPLVIGDDAVVGAGACVTKSVPAGVMVVGVPARPVGSAP